MFGFGVGGRILNFPASPGLNDANNIRHWVNKEIVFGGGQCAGWPGGGSNSLCNEIDDIFGFDTISITAPNLSWPETVSGCSSLTIGSGGSYGTISFYSVLIDGGNEIFAGAGAVIYLVESSSAWIALSGCVAGNPGYADLCNADGNAYNSCYQYALPSPPSSYISLALVSGSNPCFSASYGVLFKTPTFSDGCANSTTEITQSDLRGFCAGNPSKCSASVHAALAGTVPSCLSPDPFNGSIPP